MLAGNDPTLGRFFTEDPARYGGVNWYEYGSDNPLTEIDPTGLLFGGLAAKAAEAIGAKLAQAGAKKAESAIAKEVQSIAK
jgi:uncharacterized protein RhaS with RHS repeats